MANRYVCEACNKGCRFEVLHTCDKTCSDYVSFPTFVSTGVRISCDLCKRNFRSQTCFDNHKRKWGGNKKSERELRKSCSTHGALITHKTHECNTRFCVYCNANKRRQTLLHEASDEFPGVQRTCTIRIVRFRDYEGYPRSDKAGELACTKSRVLTAVLFQMRYCIRYRAGLRTVRIAQALVLGKPSGRYVGLSVRAPALGKEDNRNCS